MSYSLSYPAHIIFGWGERKRLADLLPPTPRYALVLANSQVRQGLPDEIAATLGEAAIIRSGITPDPLLGDVDSILESLRGEPVDAVVAIGGGSVIDAAKAAAALAPLPGSTADYFYGKREITKAGLPFFALPTTAGTGAEITRNAVLTDPETTIKQSIRHPSMVPTAAIIDPELTLSMPPETTAASGLDALTQAIESYLSANATPVTMALARQAVQIIVPALPRAFAYGLDREARTRMAEGSMITAMAFSHSGLGAVHGIAHPLGALLHQKHGLVCAVLLPYVLQYNASSSADRLNDLAKAVDLSTATEFIDAVRHLVADLQVPATFAFAGLNDEHVDFIVENCRSNSMRCNPRAMPDEDVRALLAQLTR